MTALCSGKICTIFPEKGALNLWKACTIALEYSRNRELVDLVEEKLRAKKIIPQILKNRMGVLDLNAKISIGTYHSAKGLEFDMVFLPFCSMKYLPSEERVLANESRDEALKEETKLLYVAITRAKRGLILSYTEEKTELLLEVDTSLYDERELK